MDKHNTHRTANMALNLLWLHERGELDDVGLTRMELCQLHNDVLTQWSDIDRPHCWKYVITEDRQEFTDRIVKELPLFTDTH